MKGMEGDIRNSIEAMNSRITAAENKIKVFQEDTGNL